MLDRYLKLSVTLGACLVVSTAGAAEPLPVYTSQVEGVAGNIESLDRPTVVYGDQQADGHYQGGYPAAGGSYAPMPGWRGRVQVEHWEKWGYPGEFRALPLGLSFNAALDAQVSNGLVAQLVLYRMDFQQPTLDREPTHLVAHGQLRLSKMSARLANVPHPLIVETSGDAALDAARRQYVLSELNKYMPYPMPAEKVVIGYPCTRGISGQEAVIIDENFMRQTLTRGMSNLPSVPGKILSPLAPAPSNINLPAN